MIEDVKNQGRTGIYVNFLIGTILLAVIMACHFFGIGLVASGSMDPALKKGDIVLLRKYGDYKTGDIVVYESGDSLIVHRVTRADGTTVTTKGDANNVPDEPVTADSIKGVVCGRLFNFPYSHTHSFTSGLLARFVTEASGSSTARVAVWDVTALEEEPGTLEITAGAASPDTDDEITAGTAYPDTSDEITSGAAYPDTGYEFTVQSNSETTAEYVVSVNLYDELGEAPPEGMTLGLFEYDSDSMEWTLVSESSGGELQYGGLLPIGWNYILYRLSARTDDESAAGNYKADIDVDVTQVD